MGTLSERGERLLLQALKQSNIDEPNETNQFPFLLTSETIYWHRVGDDIEIVFKSAHWFTGRLNCSITLGSFVENTLRHFPKDADAVLTLVDVLAYLQGNLSALTLDASRGIFLRSHNLVYKTLSTEQKLAIAQAELIVATLTTEAPDRFTELTKRLRAEPGRGGSTPRLEHHQRQSLHEQYDQIRQIAGPIRKDYTATLHTFQSSHSRGARTWEEWQEFWRKYASDLYKYDPEFLLLFADQDNPSASEVSYRWLAKQTSYTRSYVERRVLESRKDAGKSKRRKKPTVKHQD